MRLPSALFFMSLCFIACNNTEKKQTPLQVDEETSAVITVANPTQANSQLPRLFSNGSELYFSWVTQKDSMDILNYSVFRNGSWTETTEINRGNDWFTNWADFPAIAENSDNILTSFLQKSDTGTYTYDVKLNLYKSKEKTWKKNFILHNDGTQSEHGFVTIRPYVDSSFFVTWLDGRETVGKGHGGGQMTLRGAIVFEDGSIDYDTLLDDRICDCCQTSAAIGANDELIVAYRDRSEDEIRDISVVDWTRDSGWSEPKTIGNDQWKIAGCPVNGPSMDAFESTVALAWFTASAGEGDIKVAFSEDNGASFGPSFRIDAGNATGRVDLVMLTAEEAAVLWMQPQGDDEVILLMKINKHGYTGYPVTIAKTSPERASGFPQVERLGETLYMAWTMLGENNVTSIEMASLEVSQL